VTEDDDWFERALREDEEGEDVESGADGSGADEPEAEAEEADFEDLETDEAESEFGDPDGSFADGSPESESGNDGVAEAGSTGASTDEDGDELFDEGFGSAFQNAPGGGPSETDDASGGGGFGESGGVDAGGGFGGETGGGGDFGMGGGGDDFGMGGGFGGGDEPFESEEFDDEEFESSIPRIDVGIEGLDSMIQGGVPERSLVTTIGSAGTGKTTFGLQFLHEGLQQGESAVFITLEESHDRIVDTASEKGWDFEAYEEEGSLAVIDLDPIEMANSLTSIRNDLPRLVEEFGATRLVLDSVSLLEMMYDDQATRRNEIYDFTKSLKEAGVTTMLTSEASEDSAYASRHGIIEYLVDAVFILRYIRSTDDFQETRLAVEIQKIRDANHSREIKPYSITNEGISVYRQANIF
jgi:KaiC domain protein